MNDDLWTRLIQARRDGNDEDRCWLWEQRRKQRYDELPRPICCEIGRSCIGVSNSFDSDETPTWQIMTWKREQDWTQAVPVNFCPGCGGRLPPLRRKTNPPPHLMVVTDGGYYCDECGERGQSCPCSFPSAAWEIAS